MIPIYLLPLGSGIPAAPSVHPLYLPWILPLPVFSTTSCVSVQCTSVSSAQLPFSSKVYLGCLLIEGTTCISHRLLREHRLHYPPPKPALLSGSLPASGTSGNGTGLSTFILPSLLISSELVLIPDSSQISQIIPHLLFAFSLDSLQTSFSPNGSQNDLFANLPNDSCLKSFK